MAAIQHDVYRQTCFGSGDKDLNLKALRARIDDMKRTLDQVIFEMETAGAHWERLLGKLAVVNFQHMQITEALRPLLKVYTVYPIMVDSPQVAADMPNMLASRLLPDMEALEAAALADIPGGGEAALMQQPEQVLAAAEEELGALGAAVAYLTAAAMGDDSAGILDSKAPQRRTLETTSREIQKLITAASKPAMSAAQLSAPAAGAKRARPADAAGADEQQQQREQQLVLNLVSGAAFTRSAGTAAGPKPVTGK